MGKGRVSVWVDDATWARLNNLVPDASAYDYSPEPPRRQPPKQTPAEPPAPKKPKRRPKPAPTIPAHRWQECDERTQLAWMKFRREQMPRTNKPPALDPKTFRRSFYTSDAWRELRARVLLKYGRLCLKCGAKEGPTVRIHVDHIKPRSRFPALALVFDNLQPLCEPCNTDKSDTDMTDYRPKHR